MDFLHLKIVGKKCSVSVIRGPIEGDDCYMVCAYHTTLHTCIVSIFKEER